MILFIGVSIKFRCPIDINKSSLLGIHLPFTLIFKKNLITKYYYFVFRGFKFYHSPKESILNLAQYFKIS